MKNTRRLLAALVAGIFLAATGAQAQRTRPVSSPAPEKTEAKPPVPGVTANVPPAPQTVKVKYEGGVFGYTEKMDGTLTFDDQNRRLVFVASGLLVLVGQGKQPRRVVGVVGEHPLEIVYPVFHGDPPVSRRPRQYRLRYGADPAGGARG